MEALNACIKLFADKGSSLTIFFCQIIPSEDEINPTKPDINASKDKPSFKSDKIIINAPQNPSDIPNHWFLVSFSFK